MIRTLVHFAAWVDRRVLRHRVNWVCQRVWDAQMRWLPTPWQKIDMNVYDEALGQSTAIERRKLYYGEWIPPEDDNQE